MNVQIFIKKMGKITTMAQEDWMMHDVSNFEKYIHKFFFLQEFRLKDAFMCLRIS